MEQLELVGDGLDGGRLLAWMLFPHNRQLRQVHFVRELVKQEYIAEGGSDKQVTLPTWMLQTLLDGPSDAEMVQLAAESTKRGTVAGDLLGLIYEMHVRGVMEPSFGKAIKRYKEFALGLKYGDGDALKYSEQTLRNYFNEFANVAHFWAAFRLNQGPYAFTEDSREVFHVETSFLKFLGVSKSIGSFAASFIPKRTKPPHPVIDQAQIVRVPDSVPSLTLRFKRNPS